MPGTASSGGRNKKSAKQHRLEGTYQKVRHAKTPAPPDPPKGRPPMPFGLIGLALEEWTRMVTRLEVAKTIATVDDAALYQYCCLFAETEAIAAARTRNDALIATLAAALARTTRQELADMVGAIEAILPLKKLEVKYTTQLRQGRVAIRQYLIEFGMTPASRSRVAVTETPAPEDPFAEFDEPAQTH